MTADVTDLAQMTTWVRRTAEHWGGIDILVNNAGGATVGTLAELADSAWQESFATNFFAPVALSRIAAEQMARARGRRDHQYQLHLRARGGWADCVQRDQGGVDFSDQDAGA